MILFPPPPQKKRVITCVAEAGFRSEIQWNSLENVVQKREALETRCSSEDLPARDWAGPANTLALGVRWNEEKASHVLQSQRGF